MKIDLSNSRGGLLVVRAIDHPLRQAILNLLLEKGESNVTGIYTNPKISKFKGKKHIEQSVVSQHLKIMRDAGLVETDRQGKFIFYKPNRVKLSQITGALESLVAAKSE